MYVTNGPVGVVGQRVHGLDGHHWTFEGGHAVERQRDNQEAQDRVGTQFVPGAGQGHHAVDHAAPGGCQQDQGHHHTQGLSPVRQSGVVQVVRTSPDVDGDQRPEVHDGQAIGIDRTLSLLGYEVVHHAKEAGGQEETNCVVAVPPLHHSIGSTGVHRVGLGQGNRHRHAVDDVQYRNGDDKATEEPVAHVDVLHLTLHDGAEEHQRVAHPHNRDQDVDWPFQLSVFLAAGQAHGQSDRRENDNRLPTPEGESSEAIGYQAGLRRALDHIVGGSEQGTSAKGEDDRVSVQRTQTSEGSPRQAKVQFRPDQLGRNKDAHGHAHDTPDHRHDGELAYHLIVIGCRSGSCAHARFHG